MNKKLIALAVAGAVISPAALAQTANPVTLYGLIDVTFETVKADAGGSSAAIPNRNRVTNQASRIGIRGTEDLGGGLKAFFQVEQQVNPDDACGQGGNPAGGTLPNGGCAITGNGGKAWASRNSAVGLQGGFGSVLLGRYDTPYKLASLPADPWGDVTISGYVTSVHDNSNFDRRENNAVQFWTANFSGFSARAHYSANEGKSSGSNPYTMSFSATYDNGPLYVGASYEKHFDQNGAAALQNAEEKGTELAATFKMGALKLGGVYEVIKKSGAALSGTKDQKNKYVSATFATGAATWVATYGMRKDGALGTAAIQPDAKAAGVGVIYSLSKRSTVYAQYEQIKNNNGAAQNFGNNGLGGVAAGNDPKGFGVGIKHTF